MYRFIESEHYEVLRELHSLRRVRCPLLRQHCILGRRENTAVDPMHSVHNKATSNLRRPSIHFLIQPSSQLINLI